MTPCHSRLQGRRVRHAGRWGAAVVGVEIALGCLDLQLALVVAAGTVGLLLGLLFWLLAAERREAMHLVDIATAGLRAAESESGRQAALLDAVLNSISDGVRVIDANGEVLLHNRAAKDMLGLDLDAPQPQPQPQTSPEPFQMFLPDGLTPYPVEELPLMKALRGEAADDVDIVIRHAGRPDGLTISASGRPLLDVAGLPSGGAVAVFQDVTHARSLRSQLQAEHEVQERLLTALSDLGAGVSVTEDGRLVFVNAAYAAMLGYEAEAMMGLTAVELTADPVALQECRRALRALPEGGSSGALTTRLRHRDGHVVPVELMAISVKRPQGLQRVGLIRDLTGSLLVQAELEQRARQLESANQDLEAARDLADAASKAKSEFVANMSHELRTPLNGVLGVTAMLLDSGLTDEQRELADTASHSGAALLAVINDILDFSKIEAGRLLIEPVDVDLPELLHDVAELFAVEAAAAGLDLLVECPARLPALHTDPARLRQVLTNLVGNAVKFTAAGSVVLRCRLDGDGLRIEVADTGPGIAPDSRARLFTAFEQADSSTTRRFGGTGLGLAISRQLAGLLGGSLECSGSPGTGSTFTLTLPVQDRAATGDRAAGDDATRERQPALEGLRVRLLHATPALERHLRGLLIGWGARVSAADDPAAVDVVLADARRSADPDGLGAETHRVVLLTCPGQRVGRLQALQAPNLAVALALPVRPARLLAALRRPVQALPVPRGTTSPRSARTALHVLVAEDNAINQLVATAMLARLGHRSDVVGTGREAVAAARATAYDVVLMDCQMPDIDGLEATRLLRADPATRALPVVALTASASVQERDACLNSGMDAFLSKPVLPADLAETLERVTRRDPGPGPARPAAPDSSQQADVRGYGCGSVAS